MNDALDPTAWTIHPQTWSRVAPTDIDPVETREWLDAFRTVLDREGRERATFLLRKLLDEARARRVPLPPVLNTPYCNSDRPRRTAAVSGQSRHRGAHRRRSVRWNALAMVVRANRAHARARRPHRDLRLDRRSVRGRLQPFLSGRDAAGRRRRPRLLPAARRARRLRPRLSRRAPDRGAARTTTAARRGGGGLSSYCHPWLMPDFWQFPTGVDGPRADARRSTRRASCATSTTAAAGHGGPQGVDLRRRRRDGRARVARRAVARRARGPRQSDLRRQLQPAAARRPGARQRLDHPGARRTVRRRRLERDQAAVGLGLGPAVRARRTTT